MKNFDSPNLENEVTESLNDNNLQPKNKKLIWILAISLVSIIIILSGIFTFYYYDKKGKELAKELERENSTVTFLSLGEMIINLDTKGKGISYVKLKISFEIYGLDNIEATKKWMPKIKDIIVLYLRELRPSDLYGSIGLYKLREELLLRINKVLYPNKITDIVFEDVLIQ